MTFTPDIDARMAVVVLAIIFSIAYKRRQGLFTVKNAARDVQAVMIEGFVSREIRDTNLQLWLSGGLGAFALAYCMYSIVGAA